MPTKAGVAVVDFRGNFDALIAGAAASVAKIGDDFTKGRDNYDALWRTFPASVRNAEQFVIWTALDEACEPWILASDAAMRDVIGSPVCPAQDPGRDPALGEYHVFAINWWLAADLPAEAFALIGKGSPDRARRDPS